MKSLESKPMFNRNGRHYPTIWRNNAVKIVDDYAKFHNLKNDLKDICLEVTDDGINAHIFHTPLIPEDSKAERCTGSRLYIEFQYKSNISTQRVFDNDYKFMNEDFLDEVVERITLFMCGNGYTTKVIKTYDKCSSHHNNIRNVRESIWSSKKWFLSLKRIINKRKGRVYITRLEFFKIIN
jgi:hypothetical protein